MDNLEKVFSKIYDQNIERIYRFVFLKVSSEDIAKDLTSETFLRAWGKFKRGDQIDNPKAFLYQVARNLVIDHYREKGKAKIISADASPIIDPRENLEERAAFNSDLNSIKIKLADLKEDYQNVIVWHYLEGFSVREIAKMMDRTEDTTRVLLHRALESLKKKMNKTEEV